MRLRGLLDRPELGLVLHTGANTGPDPADRPITGVYTTDLPDPSRFLTGGELVLTGLVWWRQPGDAERFVAALADSGVCALAAGTVAHDGVLPDDVRRACAARGLPLVEVPEHVSFAALTELVVLELAAAPPVTGLAAAAEHAAATLGGPCWVLSVTGRVVAGADPPPAARRQLLVRQYLTAESLPDKAGSGTVRHSVWPGAGWWFLAAAGDHATWTPVQRAAAAALTSACATEWSEVDGARAQAHTAAPAARGSVCVLAGRGQAGLLDELVAHLGTGSVHAVRAVHDGLVAVLPVAAAHRGALVTQLRELAAVLAPALAEDEHLALGLSAGTDDLAAAITEAGEAVTLARHRTGPVRLHDAAEPATARSLVSALPAELLESYVDRVLGPVLAYDRGHGGGLLTTLRVFVACSGSWSRAAARLHVHVNTLRYRIGRIEDLTGRDLSSITDQADIHLALALL